MTPSSKTITTVLSPTDRAHAVRPDQQRTVCGWDFTRRQFSRGYALDGWTQLGTSYDITDALRCSNCDRGLADGTGPGA